MKDSSAAGPGRFLAELDPDEDFSVLAGGINFFYSSLHVGASGGVLSLANVVPDACTELYDLFVRGMYDRARELSAGLIRLNHSISGAWGVAGVKAAMDLVGLRGGRPREPLTPVPAEAIAQIKQALMNEGFLVTSR